MSEQRAFLGVDIGGTFTDIVLSDTSGAMHVGKVLTTPHDPRQAVQRGIDEVLARAGENPAAISRVVHGTTLATNVILQRAGATVAFVTTAGFADMLRLGREARVEGDRYDLLFNKPAPPVEHAMTVEVVERVAATGEVIEALESPVIDAAVARLIELQPEAVAICLLNSHVNSAHEAALAAACRAALPDAYVAASCEVWPEMREYDRAMTTVMSAYVGPRMAEYLGGLQQLLVSMGIQCPVDIMESSGGVISAALAAQRPIYTVESGGAAGVTAAGFIGNSLGHRDVISFDMGGTTAKAGVVRGGRADITHNFQVGGKGSYGSIRSGTGFPVKIPVVDLAEVGAGGGSIAWVDVGGSLHIGPQSAGSLPGPACYGRGGTAPTVTDANLVLGYLDPRGLADDVTLDRTASVAAIESAVAGPLGLHVEEAAWAIHDLVNANMAAAIHVVTVQRGVDPRAFALIAFGGAGPLHAASLADAFGIETVVVPWAAGVASAVGLVAADLTVHHVRAVNTRLGAGTDPDEGTRTVAARLEDVFRELEAEGRRDLYTSEADARFAVHRFADVRHVGQAHQLSVDVPDDSLGPPGLEVVAEQFRARYREAYGIALGTPVEIVNLRVRVSRLVDKVELGHHAPDASAATAGSTIITREAWFPPDGVVTAAVHQWSALEPGWSTAGPAIIHGADTTVLVPGNRSATVDARRNLTLTRRESAR